MADDTECGAVVLGGVLLIAAIADRFNHRVVRTQQAIYSTQNILSCFKIEVSDKLNSMKKEKYNTGNNPRKVLLARAQRSACRKQITYPTKKINRPAKPSSAKTSRKPLCE